MPNILAQSQLLVALTTPDNSAKAANAATMFAEAFNTQACNDGISPAELCYACTMLLSFYMPSEAHNLVVDLATISLAGVIARAKESASDIQSIN